MISPPSILRLYDEEMRRDPVPDLGSRVERIGPIVRLLGPQNYILYSDLDGPSARAVIAEQVAYFRQAGAEVEWKVFGHDRPENLDTLLREAGFTPAEQETLVVFDLQKELPGEAHAPPGIEIRQVSDEAGVRDAAAANFAAFGKEDADAQAYYSRLVKDPNQGVFVAYARAAPVASGRIELTPGRSFAGLWGGGTDPIYRHKGIYRSLVRARADLAKRRGYRFLTVDARDTSRPILTRLGFLPIATTRPWILRQSLDNPVHAVTTPGVIPPPEESLASRDRPQT